MSKTVISGFFSFTRAGVPLSLFGPHPTVHDVCLPLVYIIPTYVRSYKLNNIHSDIKPLITQQETPVPNRGTSPVKTIALRKSLGVLELNFLALGHYDMETVLGCMFSHYYRGL